MNNIQHFLVEQFTTISQKNNFPIGFHSEPELDFLFRDGQNEWHLSGSGRLFNLALSKKKISS
jgi:hypothetical protein